MSDISDISQIAGKFKKVAELRDYAEKLFIKLQASADTIQKQQAEIAHLKKLLDGAVVNKIAPHDIPHEQLICEMEIARLQKIVQDRPLSLEEVRIFDTYVKDLISIKQAIRDSSAEEDDHSVEFDETKLIELVKHGRNDK